MEIGESLFVLKVCEVSLSLDWFWVEADVFFDRGNLDDLVDLSLGPRADNDRLGRIKAEASEVSREICKAI